MKLKYIYIAFYSILMVGCEKYLEEAPDQRAVLDSPEKISELLTSAYPKANYFPFAETMSDNAGDKGAGMGSMTFINFDAWTFSDIRSRNQDTPDFFWYGSYEAIAAANRALAYIATVDDPERYQAQKGEALVARAYAHFMLAVFFANTYDRLTADTDPGIPYVTEPEEQLLLKYERKTVAYVYQMIEQDLLTGLPLLNDSKYKAPKYHFTRSAAHAFAARFYLFKKEYGKVIEHASQVFTDGDFSSRLRPINQTAFRSMEYYERQAEYTRADNPANILLVESISSWGGSFPGFRFGLTADILAELFFSRNVTGGSFAYTIFGQETSFNIPKFKTHFVRSGLNANFGYSYNMIPLFSAEEVLLNRAEALAMEGRTDEAIADLNVFASKKVFASQNNPYYYAKSHEINAAKLISFYQQPDLKYCIVNAALDFKRREYIFEGMRYLDILRHRLPVLHKTKDGQEEHLLGSNDLRRVLQIPKEVAMSGMETNPR
ncbi:RagB/SusD family nutrient uptake outer membrane protein [Sphingobacterium humi]|uniref:RagB/SusD family nutrient uptake outer membrane protein n=1 Tax=Sphingobacterium humi TaxID=1796905 RepID=A0A6N8L270_9SPHI|nr:RagB/SusD family nutrient uptake outer membrane protein [Sphingobacterium humi]MVZ62591.1 RagB/SusD family nutrient uptake outer membrane protein [Sphingobacterium humi]